MLVAKKKSLFDDRPMEIQELTYIIKQVQCTHALNFCILYLFIYFLIGNIHVLVTAYKPFLSVAILQRTFSYTLDFV